MNLFGFKDSTYDQIAETIPWSVPHRPLNHTLFFNSFSEQIIQLKFPYQAILYCIKEIVNRIYWLVLISAGKLYIKM